MSRRHVFLLAVLFALGVGRRVSVPDDSLVQGVANGDEAIEGKTSEESMKASREGEESLGKRSMKASREGKATLGTQTAVADTAKHSTRLDSAGSSLPAQQPSLVQAVSNGDEAIEGENSEESMKASRKGDSSLGMQSADAATGEQSMKASRAGEASLEKQSAVADTAKQSMKASRKRAASLGTQGAVADAAKQSTRLDSAGSSLPAQQPFHETTGLFEAAVSGNARLAWGVAAAEAVAFLLVACFWQSCSARLCPKHSEQSRWHQSLRVSTENDSQPEVVHSALSERPGERLGRASGVLRQMLQEDAPQLTDGQQQDLRLTLEVLEEEGAKRALCPRPKVKSRWVTLDSVDTDNSSDKSDSSSDNEPLPLSPSCNRREKAITADAMDADEFKEMVEFTDMDETTRRWLQSFAGKQLEASASPTSNGNLVEPEPALKEIMGNLSAGLSELLEQFADWQKFSLARLDELSAGAPLLHSSLAAMHSRGLLAKLTLPGEKVRSFVVAIEGKYNTIAFHNSLHAADAVQAAHSLMGNSVPFQDLEVFSVLIAALVIDVGHPGVSNEFRTQQRDESALIYNDQCVNENMHCSIAYQTAAAEGCNWLSHLPFDTERRLRALLVPMVLSTDTCQHARILEDAKSGLCRYGVDVSEWPSLLPLLELLVHSSDLAGRSARGPDASAKAFDRFLEELFLQGDREKELHLPPSPLCDRASVSALDAHWRFLDLVAAPTFRLVGSYFDAEAAEEQLQQFHGVLAEQTGQVGADMAWVLSDMGQMWDPSSSCCKPLPMVHHHSLPLKSAMSKSPSEKPRGVRFAAIHEELASQTAGDSADGD